MSHECAPPCELPQSQYTAGHAYFHITMPAFRSCPGVSAHFHMAESPCSVFHYASLRFLASGCLETLTLPVSACPPAISVCFMRPTRISQFHLALFLTSGLSSKQSERGRAAPHPPRLPVPNSLRSSLHSAATPLLRLPCSLVLG